MSHNGKRTLEVLESMHALNNDMSVDNIKFPLDQIIYYLANTKNSFCAL